MTNNKFYHPLCESNSKTAQNLADFLNNLDDITKTTNYELKQFHHKGPGGS